MGWFKARAQQVHREALANAARLVSRYREGETKNFVFDGIPIEFWSHLRLRFENLLWHVENTGDAELGDSRTMRELHEDLGFAHLICSKKYDRETQRNFRTLAFDNAVERLRKSIANPDEGKGTVIYGMRDMLLESQIADVETALAWFAEIPAPQSKKYSAAQATTLVALGKEALAAIKRERSDMAVSALQRSRDSTILAHAPERQHEAPASPAFTDGAALQSAAVCPSCETVNGSDAAFCKRCGARLAAARTCAACQTANDSDAAFCKRCGAPLNLAAEPHVERTAVPVDRLISCSHCGKKLRPGTRRCPRCSHSL